MSLTPLWVAPEHRDEYNAFVDSQPHADFSQLWEWGEVKEDTGWEPLRLLVRDGPAPVGSLQLLQRRIPRTRRTILYAPRGPMAEPGRWEVWDMLIAEARAEARRRGAILLKIDPAIPAGDSGTAAYLAEKGFRLVSAGENFEGIQPRFVYRLDIRPSREELLANLHPKTRYNIRLAQRRGVEVRRLEDPAGLDTFYDILVETARRDGFLIRDRAYFRSIRERMVPRERAAFYLATYQGRVIAGTLAMFCRDTCWYLYGASSNRDRQVMPNYLLQWHMIEEAQRRGCLLYDFRGVSGDLRPDNPLYGLYRFKKGFGGELTEFLGEYDLVISPGAYRAWRTAEPLWQKGVRWWMKRKKGGP